LLSKTAIDFIIEGQRSKKHAVQRRVDSHFLAGNLQHNLIKNINLVTNYLQLTPTY
jgi:hypothetical protein